MAFQGVVQALQVGQVFGAGLHHRLVRAAAFQQRHHREQVGRVGVGHGHHARAAPRHQFHQAFGGQHLQRFTQWRAADLPGGGQRVFVDELARRQFAFEHQVPQPRGHAVVQRGAVQGDGVGHGCESNSVIL